LRTGGVACCFLIMIDDLVILFSTLMCVTVVLRAIWLDQRVPWFGPGTEPPEPKAAAPAEAAVTAPAETAWDVS
jgi:hypothetical protein